jgi:transcriptional regulator of acetoin/glycerol metabolism
METLMRYSWPGNMRELQHVAKFAMALSETPRIDLASLPSALQQQGCCAKTSDQKTKPRQEADITSALNSENWNVSSTAKKLGISRSTLHRRIIELNLQRPKHRP